MPFFRAEAGGTAARIHRSAEGLTFNAVPMIDRI